MSVMGAWRERSSYCVQGLQIGCRVGWIRVPVILPAHAPLLVSAIRRRCLMKIAASRRPYGQPREQNVTWCSAAFLFHKHVVGQELQGMPKCPGQHKMSTLHSMSLCTSSNQQFAIKMQLAVCCSLGMRTGTPSKLPGRWHCSSVPLITIQVMSPYLMVVPPQSGLAMMTPD